MKSLLPALLMGFALSVLSGCASNGNDDADRRDDAAKPETASLERFEFRHRQMGTYFNVALYAPDEATAKQAADAAFERVDQLNRIMSDWYRPSELNKLSATAGSGRKVPVSEELGEVLIIAAKMSEVSSGAFDITVGPVVKLWRAARRSGEMPKKEELREALAPVGYQKIKLPRPDVLADDFYGSFNQPDQGDKGLADDHAADALRVELTAPNMQLDLGGIAKGYAGDEMLRVLRQHGVTRAMIDAGGDIVVGAAPPGRAGWRIGIAPLDAADAPPSRYVTLTHAAIATSGDAWQYVEIDGQRYSHIVDPKTGLGLTERSSVTVIVTATGAAMIEFHGTPGGSHIPTTHRVGTYADALASAISVLGPQRGVQLADQLGVAAIVIRKPDEEVRTYESKKVNELTIKAVEDDNE